MKKSLLYILISAAVLCFSSCEKDILDVDPLDSFTDAAIFGDLTLAETYLNTLYQPIYPENGNINRFSSMTDEQFQMHEYYSTNFTNGLASTDHYSFGYWAPLNDAWSWAYGAIKDINFFMEKVDQIPAEDEREINWRNELKGQGYFLRSYFYSYLWNFFYKFPLVTNTFDLNFDFSTIQQAERSEVYDYIITQIDSAIILLPNKYTDASDYGRATKGAAMAVKANLCLWAASPLYDETGNGHDQAKWQKAADACKALVDLADVEGLYSLTEVTTSEEYTQLFTNHMDPEIIYARLYVGTEEGWYYHPDQAYLMQAPCGVGSGFEGWSAMQPTQTLVDRFQMADGSEFVQNPDDSVNPYTNRDLRLHGAIFCDGDIWGYGDSERPIEIFIPDPNDEESNALAESNPTAYSLLIGKDSKQGEYYWNASKTGYNPRKYLDKDFDTYGTLSHDSPGIIYRLSEFYLSYAECLINLGNDNEALKYINKVRTRAQMPAYANATDIWEKYENERIVELCFEGQRFFDLRRWKKMADVYNSDPITGLEVYKYPDGHKRYVRLSQSVGARVWAGDFMYWFPIPDYELRSCPQFDAYPYQNVAVEE